MGMRGSRIIGVVLTAFWMALLGPQVAIAEPPPPGCYWVETGRWYEGQLPPPTIRGVRISVQFSNTEPWFLTFRGERSSDTGPVSIPLVVQSAVSPYGYGDLDNDPPCLSIRTNYRSTEQWAWEARPSLYLGPGQFAVELVFDLRRLTDWTGINWWECGSLQIDLWAIDRYGAGWDYVELPGGLWFSGYNWPEECIAWTPVPTDTPTPTETATPTPTLSETLTPTATPSPSHSPTPTETALLTPTPSVTPSVTRTPGPFFVFLPIIHKDYSPPLPPGYDLMIRDREDDDGSVCQPEPWWSSPDVWVRRIQDNGTEYQYPQPGQRNYIYLRVRNLGPHDATNVRVWAEMALAAMGLRYPEDTTYVGEQIIPLFRVGETRIVVIPWDVPQVTGHFCIMGLIDAEYDPLPGGYGQRLVPCSNNAAIHNVIVVAGEIPIECGQVATGFYEEAFSLSVVNGGVERAMNLNFIGEVLDSVAVIIEPGELAGRWTSLENMELQADGTLRVIALPASIVGVPMLPNERATLVIHLRAPAGARLRLQLEQMLDGLVVGGNEILRSVPYCNWLAQMMQPWVQIR